MPKIKKPSPAIKNQLPILTPKEQERFNRHVDTTYAFFEENLKKMATRLDDHYLGWWETGDKDAAVVRIYYIQEKRTYKNNKEGFYTLYFLLNEDDGSMYTAEDFSDAMSVMRILEKWFAIEQHKRNEEEIEEAKFEALKKQEEAIKLKTEAAKLQSKLTAATAA